MNTVFNFSFHGVKDLRPGLRSAVVPSDTPAKLAAEIAEINKLDVLVVQDEKGKTKGTFFPGFLREHLPTHPAVAKIMKKGKGLSTRAAPLSNLIKAIDLHLPDFHSELVNLDPNLRVCPVGPHVLASDPCPKHHVPTEPY